MNNSNLGLKLLSVAMAGLTLLLLVIYVVMFFLNRPVTPSQPVSYNMFFPEKTSENTISYYNDNHFLRLDTSTQEVSSLTPNIKYPIPNVRDVIWTSHGAYFRFGYPPSTSNLADLYAEKTYDTEHDITQQYWYAGYDATSIELGFIVDVSPHPSVISSGEDVVFSRDGSLWQRDKNGAITEIQQITSGPGRFMSPLFISGEKTVVALHGTRESEVFSIDRTSRESTSVAKLSTENTQGIRLFANSNTVYAVSAVSESEQQLVSYSLSDNQSSELLSPFTGLAYGDGKDVYAMYTGEDEIVIYKLNGTDTQRLYRFADKTSLPSSVHCMQSKCYFVNNLGVARVLSHDEQVVSNVRAADSSAIEKVVSIDGVSLTRNVLSLYDNSYNIIVGQGDITAPYTQLQDELRAKNIDPYDYTFTITQGRFAQPSN